MIKISQQPENCENRNDPDLVQAFLEKWWVESDFKAPNLPLSLRLKGSGYRVLFKFIGDFNARTAILDDYFVIDENLNEILNIVDDVECTMIFQITLYLNKTR
jgi:hypothetical protein